MGKGEVTPGFKPSKRILFPLTVGVAHVWYCAGPLALKTEMPLILCTCNIRHGLISGGALSGMGLRALVVGGVRGSVRLVQQGP